LRNALQNVLVRRALILSAGFKRAELDEAVIE
jgi:hypothetical protein